MNEERKRSSEAGLQPRERQDLAARSDALAQRVLGDLASGSRRILLLCVPDGPRAWVRETLEAVPGIRVVDPIGDRERDLEGVDLVIDFEDGRGAHWRREHRMRPPLLLMCRGHAGESRVRNMRSLLLDPPADLAQVTESHFGGGAVALDEQRLQENVAIGVELADAVATLDARRREGWKARVLWVSQAAAHAEAMQGLFLGRPWDFLGAAPCEAASAFLHADPPVDVLVCPFQDAVEALDDLAVGRRASLAWIGEGGDPSVALPPDLVACIRGALPWGWVRLDEPIDAPGFRLTHLNPVGESILRRALEVHVAMLRAATSGRLALEHGGEDAEA